VKYFATVSRPPAYGLAVLLAVTLIGIATTRLNPRELDSSLGMVLFVHMLLSSSGFASTARRGHYDPMLVAGRRRTRALVAQWCASVAPGTFAWLGLAMIGVLLRSPAGLSALAGSRAAAFWIVSAIAWPAGFLLPRGAGGGLWIGLLLVLLVWHADLVAPAAAPDSAVAIARGAATLVLCPFLLLGDQLRLGAPSIAAAAGAAAVVLLTTWRFGARLDVFLLERS
jgi:hypothetical protein